MFNLAEIMANAQGGQALDNLAQQFGISKPDAEAAVNSLIPALSMGLFHRAADPAALSGVIGQMSDPQHQSAFNDPNAAQSPEAAQKGNDALNQIFGSSEAVEAIVQKVAQATGLSPDLLRQMLPVIASTVMGGLATSLHNQGFGGLFGQLAQAAEQGGIGSVLGQLVGGAQASAQGGGGGLGGLIGSVLGGLLGGGAAPAAPTAPRPGTPEAGLETLTNMFQPGAQHQAWNDGGLGAEIGQILGGKS